MQENILIDGMMKGNGLVFDQLDFIVQSAPTIKKPRTAADIELPFIIKDKILCSPGVWNGYYIDNGSIARAFSATRWDKDNRSLFLDHKDRDVSSWVGFAENQRFDRETGCIIGDLHILDIDTAIKLSFGAKFGISPSLDAVHDNRVVADFKFRNYAIVVQPAMLKNYINNSKIESDDDFAVWTTKFVNDLPDSSFAWIEPGGEKDSEGRTTPRTKRHLPIKDENGKIDLPHLRNALARLNQVKNIPDSVKESVKNKLEKMLEDGKNVKSKESDKMENNMEILENELKTLRGELNEMKLNFQKEFDVSDEELLEYASQTAFAGFVANMLKEKPDSSLKDIAKEYKKNGKQKPEEEEEKKEENSDKKEEEMTEEEEKKKKVLEDQKKKDFEQEGSEGKSESNSESEPKENIKTEPAKEMSSAEKFDALKSKITELEAKLQPPTRDSDISTDGASTKNEDPFDAFIGFVQGLKEK